MGRTWLDNLGAWPRFTDDGATRPRYRRGLVPLSLTIGGVLTETTEPDVFTLAPAWRS